MIRKAILLILLFILPLIPIDMTFDSYDEVPYCLIGMYDPVIDHDFQNCFYRGFYQFREISCPNFPIPKLTYTLDSSTARILIFPYEVWTHSACVMMEKMPKGQEVMLIFYGTFREHSESCKEHIIVHELCHFYYRLPDQYRKGDKIDHDCVMGNFVAYGWTGRFCADCSLQIQNYLLNHGFKRRGSSLPVHVSR